MVALGTGTLDLNQSLSLGVEVVNLANDLRRLGVIDRGLTFGTLFGIIPGDIVSTTFVSSLFTCMLRTMEGSDVTRPRLYCAAKAEVVADYMQRRGHDCNHCHGCKYTKDLGIALAVFEQRRLIYYSYTGLAPVIVMGTSLLTPTLKIARDFVSACDDRL